MNKIVAVALACNLLAVMPVVATAQTVDPRPTDSSEVGSSALPSAEPSAGWASFYAWVVDPVIWSGLAEHGLDSYRAAQQGDIATMLSEVGIQLAIASEERDWLRAHTPDPCYQDAWVFAGAFLDSFILTAAYELEVIGGLQTEFELSPPTAERLVSVLNDLEPRFDRTDEAQVKLAGALGTATGACPYPADK